MKRLRNSVLLLLAGVISISLSGAEKPQPLPKDLPPYGPLVPLHAPQVNVSKLDNGLTVWLVPRPGFPKVAFALAVRGGMANDPKDRPGLSQLLVATIDQGTKTRTAKQIAEEFEAAGGDLSGSAQADALVISTEVLADKAPSALAALADIFQNATFPESEVDLAKRNAADSLRVQESRPGFLARRTLAKVIFGDHPYSIISATQDSITKTTAPELRQAYAERFRPDQTLLVAVGDFQAESLAAQIRKSFGAWTAPISPAVEAVPEPTHENPRAVFLVPRAGSVQTTFILGAFGPTERDPDYAATEVANAIYGGMFGSRLISNIREDKGYTYSPGGFLSLHRAAGLVETAADVRNAVTGASLNEIDYELNRMATTAPSDDEMTHAQRYLAGTTAFSLQIQGAVAGRLARLWVNGLPPEEIGLESERVQKVGARDVEAVGAKYFPASRETIVAVGEEKAIRDQLAPFGLQVKTVQ